MKGPKFLKSCKRFQIFKVLGKISRFWARFQDFSKRIEFIFKILIRFICILIIYNYIASCNINIQKNTENLLISNISDSEETVRDFYRASDPLVSRKLNIKDF